MQINGLGSGHDNDRHHITNCIHDHNATSKRGGAGGAALGSVSANTFDTARQQTESSFSLSSWLRDTIGSARRLFGSIWNTTAEGSAAPEAISDREGSETVELGAEQILTQDGEAKLKVLHTPQVAAAATTVTQRNTLQNNPYFSAIEDAENEQRSIMKKLRIRFQSITGFLTQRFSFSNRNSFQTKQEQTKEDLSRHSKYREDDLEIDCILRDESHLRDSYNAKGEYSKLAGDMRSNLSVRK